MPEDKQEQIIKELKRRGEDLGYGEMLVKLKWVEGKIMAGEIIEQKIKLG